MLTVANWKRFQHYGKRRPPWIKLHRTLLDDYEYIQLPDASAALAPRLWLLASETEDGILPDDPAKLAFRLHRTPEQIIAAVNPLIAAGFLEGSLDASSVLAPRKQNGALETERETEKRERERQKPGAIAPTNGHGAGTTDDERKQEYCEAIADAFFARIKRDGGRERLTLSNAEFTRIAEWWSKRVPLATVLAGIREYSGKPETLHALVPAVEDMRARASI